MAEAITFEQFEQQVSTRQSRGYYASPEQYELEAEGSYATIRLEGCYVTDCALQNRDDKITQILYNSATDLRVPKLSASHTMSPAGPYEGIGGQHGFARWADYQETGGSSSAKHHRVMFQAVTPAHYLGVHESFELRKSELVTTTSVENHTPETHNTSIGKHWYFSRTAEDGSLLINDQSVDELLDREGAYDAVMRGEAQFWPGFDGFAALRIATGKLLEMSVSTRLEDVRGEIVETDASLGMLLWHRRGTDSICIEPTFGCEQDENGVLQNTGLTLAAGVTALMRTEIELH